MKILLQRPDARGVLTVALSSGGALLARLGNDWPLPTLISRLDPPGRGPLGEFTHVLGGPTLVGLYAGEAAMIRSAKALFLEREELYCRYQCATVGKESLLAFDAAHPEILAGIKNDDAHEW